MKAGKLYRRVYAKENLDEAWNQVWRKRGCKGAQNMEIIRFNKNIFFNLSRLRNELREGAYRPKPVREIFMEKGDGKKRPIGILAVEDRIVQRALLQVIGPLIEKGLSPFSFAYRRGLSTSNAVESIRHNFSRGLRWALHGDITHFFEDINHSILIRQTAGKIPDGNIVLLIKNYLRVGKKSVAAGERRSASRAELGLVQGAPLSPILANVYLDPFDKALTQKGFTHVRFSDDFIVQCASKKEAVRAKKTVRSHLVRLGLQIHPNKTRIIHLEKGLFFLGYHLKSQNGSKKHLLQVRPIKKKKGKEARNVQSLHHQKRGGFENKR